MSRKVRITRSLERPEAEGSHFRILCMTGKNKGISYYLMNKRIVLGRSDTADIQILDAKSSREHLELKTLGASITLTDLGSQNGVIVNDLKVSQHKLSDGDKIIIGKTVLLFNHIVVKHEVVKNEVEEDIEDDEDQEDEVEEIDVKRNNKKKKKGDEKRKKIIYGGVVLALLFVFLGDGDKKPKVNKITLSRKRKELKEDNQLGVLFSNKMNKYNREEEKKIEPILHRGLRELRERNYFRAMEEFNMALILVPNHGRASFYLNRAKQSMDEQIKNLFHKAKREESSLKYRNAKKTNCSIIRYLRDYPDDQRYKTTLVNIEQLEKSMGVDKGDIKCL